MSERLAILRPRDRVLGFVASLAITTGGAAAVAHTQDPYHEHYSGEGVTTEQYDAAHDAFYDLSRAQTDLVYVPPFTDCNSFLGITQGCEPEKFPNVPRARDSVDQAIEALRETGGREEETVKQLQAVRDSLALAIANTDTLSISTHSNQRAMLATTRQDLESKIEKDYKIIYERDEPENSIIQLSVLATFFGAVSTIGFGIANAIDIKKRFQRRFSPGQNPK